MAYEGWIDTKEKLPDEDGEFLCVKQLKSGDRSICLARFMKKFPKYNPVTGKPEYSPYWVCGGNNNIIYWMQLPAIPEGGEG